VLSGQCEAGALRQGQVGGHIRVIRSEVLQIIAVGILAGLVREIPLKRQPRTRDTAEGQLDSTVDASFGVVVHKSSGPFHIFTAIAGISIEFGNLIGSERATHDEVVGHGIESVCAQRNG